MINIQIVNINIRYQEGQVSSAQVYFNGSDEERSINLNGHVSLTAEEYEGNAAVSSLTELVKQKVINKLNESAAE